MIERTYRCNLCHDGRETEKLIGLQWTSDKSRPISEKPVRETENHICIEYATAIRIIMESRRK
jgi:hypothetical protein